MNQTWVLSLCGCDNGLRPANERRRYKVTPSLIGWAQCIHYVSFTGYRFPLEVYFLFGSIVRQLGGVVSVPWVLCNTNAFNRRARVYTGPTLESGHQHAQCGVQSSAYLLQGVVFDMIAFERDDVIHNAWWDVKKSRDTLRLNCEWFIGVIEGMCVL